MAKTAHVLIVDDEPASRDVLGKIMDKLGYASSEAPDGKSALERILAEMPDVILLDLGLPDMNGEAILDRLRADENLQHIPVVILSGDADMARISSCLEKGADDYLVKPFAYSELMARVESLVRRFNSQEEKTQLEVDGLKMDLLSREVTRDGQKIDLKPREFLLLECLMRHAGQVLTRTMLLEAVWDYHFDPQTNVIDVHISRLRQKVDRSFDEPLIHTIRGSGYVLRPPA